LNSDRGETVIGGIRRAWAFVEPATAKRLRVIAAFGVLTACLDTAALLLVYGLITLLSNSRQTPTGVTHWLIRELGVQTSSRYDTALVLLSITAGLFVVRSVLTVLNQWLALGATNTAQAGLLRRVLIGHALSPHLLRISRNSSQTLRTLAVSVDQVTFGVVGASVNIASNLAISLAVAAALFLSTPVVAITITAYFTVIAVAWTRGVRGAFMRRGASVQALQEERYRLFMQGIAAAKELQLRGRALFYAETAVAATRKINTAMRGVGILNNSLSSMLQTSLVASTVLVVGISGLTGGHASVLPAVGLVLAAAMRLLPALNALVSLANAVQYNLPAIGIVEGELAGFTAAGTAERDQTAGRAPFHDALRLTGVSFRYPTRTQDALHDVDLTIRPGETIGIIGPTGSGKSTLLDVVLGFLEPTSGEVLLDGEPLRQTRKGWQLTIGYVPQDVYLVDDTLRANIALGWRGDDIDDDAILEAVHLAELEDVVANLPNGLETTVGERGVRLSGGQRQRVGLARALYTRPSVLVLDEATSNLDRVTEARIAETLGRLPGGVTMIIVSHRISTVRNCDRILCLEDGTIRTIGTFVEVAAIVPELLGVDDGDPSDAVAPTQLTG